MNEKIITKINKQIESAQNNINSLSGEYLTNTWKRQQEQKRRDAKIDGYKFDIDILEYLKQVANYRELTTFESNLIVKSFRDAIHQYYSWDKATKNPNVQIAELVYPCIKSGTPEWQHQDLQKKIKQLQKAGICDINELRAAIKVYEDIVEKAVQPIDIRERKIKELTNNARLQQKGDINFTPADVAERLVELSGINNQSSVLEPSAGIGNIVDKVKEITSDIDVIERMSNFRELLDLKGYKLVGSDFLDYEVNKTYDVVIMNPPFSNNQDIDHVLHAYNFVKNGGLLVSIMSKHWTFAGDKKSNSFRDWIETKNYFSEHLKSGTFESTGVASEVVVIRKEE